MFVNKPYSHNTVRKRKYLDDLTSVWHPIREKTVYPFTKEVNSVCGTTYTLADEGIKTKKKLGPKDRLCGICRGIITGANTRRAQVY